MKSFAWTTNSSTVVPTVHELTNGHLLITGQTGSGKTTTTLSLLSQLQRATSTAIVFDPTGEYTQLPNVVVYRLGGNAYLDAGQFSAPALLNITGLPQSFCQLAKQAMNSLRIMQNLHGTAQVFKKINYPIDKYQQQINQLERWTASYPVDLLPAQMIEELVVPYADQRANYQVLGQEYHRQRIQEDWPWLTRLREQISLPAFQALFGTGHSASGPLVELNYVIQMFLSQPVDHQTLVIDLSVLKQFEAVQQIVISQLLKQILVYRLRNDHHLPVKIVIDEAHRYLPAEDQLADNGIFQIAREGRKANLALILTTQSPLDLSSRLRSQFSNLIVHHLAAPQEWAAFPWAHVAEDQLAVGSAIIKASLEDPITAQINLPELWKRRSHGIY
ncbi:ATP-binding protein [uncultured Limosilactobacillus sp.]|uniref:ATP-binding protein n=1 Tax=uncultured Limosilactobacillus sp. TaxID=2837629 RepID=UPI0025D95B5D|nr:ATP-binding protein [uncultured Limosilactobacillus sp.]